MRTLRTYLDDLKNTGNLNIIDEPVSSDLQAAAICGMAQRSGGPAVQFNNIVGYPGARMVGGLFSGPGYGYEIGERKMQTRIALGLGLEPMIHYEELMEILGDRRRGPIGALEVDSGSCQDVIKEGKDVNLLEFPIPKLHDKDGGRYLTAAVVMTKDAETSWTNWGVYRLMLQDKNHLVQGTIPRLTRPRDVETMVQKYAAKKEPLPFAIVLGVAPSVFFAAAQLSPPHVDDAAIAGGYMLDPIPTVKAKLSDILVPADAEIVLEGHIYPGDTADEGPFGGVSSYTPKMRNFVYSVELISHRNEPILPFVAEGMMPSDTVNIFSVFHSHDLMTFCGMLGVPIRYVTIPVEARLVLAIVSLRKKRLLGGFPFRAARTIFGMSPLVRQLIVIDEDVDSEDLATALGDAVVKAHPLKDYHISKIDKPLGWTENHDWETGLTSTLAIDAAFRVDKEPETLPTRVGFEHIIPVEVQKEVIRKWNEVLKLKPTAWSYHNE